MNMKAIALISGGLDSILAAQFIQEQGIDILPLHFRIPFCHRDKKASTKDAASLTMDSLGVNLEVIDISKEFLDLLVEPKHGFGANLNPCIDCKILMLRRAKELMPRLDAAFIVTGEILGQRPMSQNRQALELIEKRAGLEGLVLRPLSARLLEQTWPEKEGWVKRENLLDFSGRGRRPQIELAKALGIREYAQPAGGCLLTDPQFAKRVKDLMNYGELNLNNVELLKIGRHFRLSSDAKLVVGRDEEENEQMEKLACENDYLFYPDQDLAGPTSLGRGAFNADLIRLSCQVTCRYCDLNGKTDAVIIYRKFPKKEDNILQVPPIEEGKLMDLRI